MNDLERWHADLERALSPRDEEESLEIEVIKELAQRARELGPGLEDHQRQELKQGIDRLHRFVREGMTRIEDDLHSLGQQRRGIRGYGQLRSNHKSQRLHRRA